MVSKQTFLGLGLMVGGVVMVYALMKQPVATPPQVQQIEQSSDIQIAYPSAEPLTVAMEDETQRLEEAKKKREDVVRQMEIQTRQLLDAQNQATDEALRKAEEDAGVTLTVQVRPESQALAEERQRQAQQRKAEVAQQAQAREQKAERERATTSQPKQHTVQTGDSLVRLSRVYNVPIAVLAEANNMGRHDTLQRGRTIKIPSANEITKLEAQAKQREQQLAKERELATQRQTINERLAEARRTAKRQGINERYGVQVALASNQSNADILVAKYKEAGYTVTTTQTGRGVRVVIGPERTREAALLLKEKLNSDPNVSSNGAWVLQVQ